MDATRKADIARAVNTLGVILDIFTRLGARYDYETLRSQICVIRHSEIDRRVAFALHPETSILSRLSFAPGISVSCVTLTKKIFETVRVEEYLREHGDDVDLEFIFVSYTRLQFRVATEQEIANYDYPSEDEREANRQVARKDRQQLIDYGIDAAQRAGKRAFWLDFECVRNEDGVARSTSSSDDVYRICDIVRAAHSMIIAIGPSASEKVSAILKGEDAPRLCSWESYSMVTSMGFSIVDLYVVGDNSDPKSMAKRNFAERAWDDADAVKELVDHFEGSAILTQLHLIEAALTCFSRRKTDQFSQGDIAYAIMGLFPSRQRPAVDKGDSDFQAFVKLSLANDSGAFLERLICLSPSPGASWHETADRWGVKLSDVQPINKVTGVVASDIILLDGVYGAVIEWDNLKAEALVDTRRLSQLLMMFNIYSVTLTRTAFLVGLTVTMVISSTRSGVAMDPRNWIIYVLPFVTVFALFAPHLLVSIRSSTGKPLKPRLIGIEGMADASTVETYLWGFNHGRFKSTTPQSYSDTPGRPQASSTAAGDFLFTLVDTYMMTVTHFHCQVPPVAMLLLGEETEMQRAVLCSYYWRQQTFHRQTVLREGPRDLDQMHRINKVRFSLSQSPQGSNQPLNVGVSEANHEVDIEVNTARHEVTVQEEMKNDRPTWKAELLFLLLCTELSLRLLIWTFLGDRIRGWTGLALIYQPFDALRFLRYQPFVVVMVMISTALFLLPTTIGKDIIGRPVEVSWLAAHQKIFLARHAATSKYVLKDMMGIQQPRQVSAAMDKVVTVLMSLPVHHYAMHSTVIILRNLFNDNPRFS
ncbi:uncharacterized protein N0V89_001832 [Didymosphaeria variabile]|uniref:Heterokaryon incompatibility domain-containing protein n=1 Tax=Didymosphaeria variabile TaxID=1932322 RepID=A0A9W8XTP1_9PLEO|nr:uncharacterized protein N0V89_001832 [Didymosphaeria variabile]KAJ4357257.1 hypothetical protein N0V89_001832 [Didymosphaeria variabile]